MNRNAIARNNPGAFPQLSFRAGNSLLSVVSICALAAMASAAAAALVPWPPILEAGFTALLTFLLVGAIVLARYTHGENPNSETLHLVEKVSCLTSGYHDRHHTLHALATLLRASQRVPTCLLAVNDPYGKGCFLYEARVRAGVATSTLRELRPSHMASVVASGESDNVLIYGRRRWWPGRRDCIVYSADLQERRPADNRHCESLAKFLQTDAFISLPLRTEGSTVGRLHLALARRTDAWSDIRLLLDIATQTAAIIDHLDMTSAAPTRTIDERTRISRDLHDSTIQPYVGLKLGLEALRRKCAPDDELAHDIDELLQMTTDNIGELRSYVGSLKSRPSQHQKISVVPSIRSQAARFSDYHCIKVQVISSQEILVSRSLFDHIMHITREGLYNVRRHTTSKKVTIALSTIDQELLLEIANHEDARAEAPTFRPRSITDRASELGGRVIVRERHLGCTVVSIRLPLQ